MMADLPERLNKSLDLSLRRRTYESVKVVALYWEDGHQGYKDEGRAVASTFNRVFQYPTEEFAIPSSNTYAHVLGFMTRVLLEIGTAAEETKAASLLIIHYGGHGDRDDNIHQGQEKRSVWAAHRAGEPTLQWYRVQDQLDDLKSRNTDILLLLDCCFAAQAARAHADLGGRFEILAASAMGMETPAPGNTSFTAILLNEIVQQLETEDSIVVKDLHGLICNRRSQLWATPVHISVKAGQRSIRLQPLSELSRSQALKDQGDVADKYFLHLLLEIDGELGALHIDEIARWLGADTPRIVSKLVFQTTTQISIAIQKMERKSDEISSRLDGVSKQEIKTAWYQVVDLVERYYAAKHHQRHQQPPYHSSNNQRAHDFLRQLDFCNSSVISTIERNLLGELDVQNDGISMDQAIERAINDDTVRELGLVEQFRMRRMISQSEVPHNPDSHEVVFDEDVKDGGTMVEEKEYGPYINPAELPSLVARVALLADLLRTPKSMGFRALKCLKWENRTLENKFVLYFEVPNGYTSGEDSYQTLHSIIRTAKSSMRPSMDNRMAIALGIATAVQKWHSVGWVHQGINSHNILFFRSRSTGQLDYLHPFLHGFDFSRPDCGPSIGVAMDDLALNLYRHPNRQGDTRQGHRKIHDLYSLGVVLLEIGLWQTAISMLDTRRQYQARDIQKLLERCCADRVAHYAGESYKSAVATCLSSDFGVDTDNEKGSHLARAFELRVVDMIRKGICLT
ncbi:hypothetical protein ANO14919_090270 [Xylariales sp. No.14919]|nr:hypothetical protein ANO14919_090270 [Xylariales sp. No.14919]